jgi:hypothetical protein
LKTKKKSLPKKTTPIKKSTDSQIIKIIDQYSHSDKKLPKTFNNLQYKHLYNILKVDINFIDKLLKSKIHHGAHIVNTYFKLAGEGKFKGFSSKKEKLVLEKIIEKRTQNYPGYVFDYEKTEEDQFEEWDREEEEEEKERKKISRIVNKKIKNKRG